VFYLYGLEPDTVHRFRILSGESVLLEGEFQTLPAKTGPFKVMFDNAHDQQAGNADWVIDDDAPAPSPQSPSSESSWKGAFSSWGYGLHRTGRYTLTTNTRDLTFGEQSGDLADVDALVVPEPNSPFSRGELEALQLFLDSGGGLLLMANHAGSDRNSDGWDPVEIWEEVLESLDPATGIAINATDDNDDPCSNFFDDALDPILRGPFGSVGAMGFNRTASFELSPSINGTVQGLVWADWQTSRGPVGIFTARVRYGAGRILALGDSAPADDGTGASGDDLYDSWDKSGQDNDLFHLNATAWLVGDTGD